MIGICDLLHQNWLINRLHQFELTPLYFRLMLAYASIVIIIWLDIVTPISVIMTGFYYIPIIIAAWFCGPWTTVIMTVLSAAVSIEMRSELIRGQELFAQALGYGSLVISFTLISAIMYLVHIIFCRLREENETDHLTNIGNRRKVLTALQTEFTRAKRTKRIFSLIILDIDHFKKINDTYGHGVGDKILIALADEIKGLVRDIDTFGRIGGEEFLLVLPETDLLAAAEVAERIRKNIKGLTVDGVTCTVSLGVESSAGALAETTPEEMLEVADIALYSAKAAGRDTVRCVRVPETMDCLQCENVTHCPWAGKDDVPVTCKLMRLNWATIK
jgi:diguanylate cyclase (GGDEF)-like protein